MKKSFLLIQICSIFYLFSCKESEKQIFKHIEIQLDSIYLEDQFFRSKVDSIGNIYGFESKQVDSIFSIINEKDNLNLKKVIQIIEKYGWLGADKIGKNGNLTLFLVIQHSDIEIQEKYYSMIKEAANKGNIDLADFALFEDRFEMYHNRPQIYGSQILMTGKKYSIYNIFDEKNVNKRRLKVGLQPLENYVKNYGIDYKLPK